LSAIHSDEIADEEMRLGCNWLSDEIANGEIRMACLSLSLSLSLGFGSKSFGY
jgi:hypothetical protein